MVRLMPAQVVDATLAILGSPSAGEQRVSPDVERVIGRPPRTFAEWVARNAAAFKKPRSMPAGSSRTVTTKARTIGGRRWSAPLRCA